MYRAWPRAHRTTRKSRKWLWVVLVVALISAASGAVFYFYNANHQKAPIKTDHTKQVKKTEPAEGVTSSLMFVGDVFWGRSVQTNAEKSGKSYQYITSGLSGQDRAQYDAWIGNFECPITTKDVAYQLQVDILKFNCRPEYLPELAKWFTAASQANNHTMNNDGQWGLDQTRTNLQANGIQYFGTYDMGQTDDLCEVVTLPAQTAKTHKATQLPVALCGYMYVVDVAPTDAQLAVMREYAKVMPVVAMPHMGVEYRSTGEDEKISAYRRMIDNGADMVIGAHPHVIQNSESYNGHLIAYSLGNFLFDQQRLGRETSLGLAVGVKLTIADTDAAKIYARIAPDCTAYKDDCLARLGAELPARPQISVSYNFACYDEAGGPPMLGTAEVCSQAKQTATIDRLSSLSTTW